MLAQPLKNSLRCALLPAIMLLLLPAAQAEDRTGIDSAVAETLASFVEQVPEAAGLVEDAAGVLVFPDVVKVGFGIGGEYGEGALLVDGKTKDYYASSGASFGLQAGVLSTARIILFTERRALQAFRRSKSWEAGVDGELTLAQRTVDGSIDTSAGPIIVFVFSNAGVMYDLTLEGIRITPLE